MPSVTASEDQMAKIRHGNAVNLSEFTEAKLVKVFMGQGELVAIASRIAGTLFQPQIVLLGQ
jgi:tRNA pseudouridine55 synthase